MQSKSQLSEHNKYELRHATAADIDALEFVEKGSFEDYWSKESLFSFLQNSRSIVFAAWQNGEIVGYISGTHIQGEAEINRLGVLSESRRQGIASQLLHAIIEELEKYQVTKVSLEVRVSNAAGFNLYRKTGFTVRGRRPHYYKNGEDALVMVREDEQ